MVMRGGCDWSDSQCRNGQLRNTSVLRRDGVTDGIIVKERSNTVTGNEDL